MRTNRPASGVSGGMKNTIETLELLLRKTQENGNDITLIFPDESGDFIRGYVAGQIDALRLTLAHIKDIGEDHGNKKRR